MNRYSSRLTMAGASLTFAAVLIGAAPVRAEGPIAVIDPIPVCVTAPCPSVTPVPSVSPTPLPAKPPVATPIATPAPSPTPAAPATPTPTPAPVAPVLRSTPQPPEPTPVFVPQLQPVVTPAPRKVNPLDTLVAGYGPASAYSPLGISTVASRRLSILGVTLIAAGLLLVALPARLFVRHKQLHVAVKTNE